MNITRQVRNPTGRRQTSCWLLLSRSTRHTFLANKIYRNKIKKNENPVWYQITWLTVQFTFSFYWSIYRALIGGEQGSMRVYTKWRHVSKSGLNPGRIGERRVLSHHCDTLPPNELMGNKIVYSWRREEIISFTHMRNHRKIIVGVCYGITSIPYSCNLQVEQFEREALSNFPRPPEIWFRRVDDTFPRLHVYDKENFSEHFNSRDPHGDGIQQKATLPRYLRSYQNRGHHL